MILQKSSATNLNDHLLFIQTNGKVKFMFINKCNCLQRVYTKFTSLQKRKLAIAVTTILLLYKTTLLRLKNCIFFAI